jgi:hypothetical protein
MPVASASISTRDDALAMNVVIRERTQISQNTCEINAAGAALRVATQEATRATCMMEFYGR